MSGNGASGRQRVMVVYQDVQPDDILSLLRLYPVEVVAIDISGDEALRALDEPVDSLIVDWRVSDLTGVGFLFSKRTGQLTPQLILHDDRPGWEPNLLNHYKGPRDIIACAKEMSVHEVIHEFFALNGVIS